MQKPNGVDLYKIFETTSFIKKVKKIFRRNLEVTLFRKLQSDVYPQLKNDPYYGSNIKKLRNYKPETWRYRIGDYRLFFSIDEECQTIFILDIDHRKDAY